MPHRNAKGYLTDTPRQRSVVNRREKRRAQDELAGEAGRVQKLKGIFTASTDAELSRLMQEPKRKPKAR